MSKPSSIYVVSIFCMSIFRFLFHFPYNQSCNLIKTETRFCIFLTSVTFFWMTTWIKKAINFPIAKVQP